MSKSELVGREVDLLLAGEAPGRGKEEQRRRALAIAGRFRSGDRQHDAALAEGFAATDPGTRKG